MAKSPPRRRMAKKIFTVIFFLAVTALLVVYAQKVDWPAVWKVIRHYDRTALLAWRALYYFLPLLIATVGYLLLESRAKTLREKNQRKLADG